MAMLKVVLGLASALLPSEARLGTGIVDLTAKNFDEFMRTNDKVMVDFVNGPGEQTEELLDALRQVRTYGSRVPIARVCAAKNPELAKRFVPLSCDEGGQQCQHSYPQLLWFVHGEATRYHRRLLKAEYIFSFVLAMDRDLVTTISDESEISKWNRLILFKGERRSPTYKALEQLASEHMDTLAVAHLEAPGQHNVSWIAENTTTEIFEDDSATKAEAVGLMGAFGEPIGIPTNTADHRTWGSSVWPERNIAALEKWVRMHLVWSEELPEKAMEDGSVVVVGKTFEKLVLRKHSDVFFLVYAPWCGFSRKVLPIWAEFAQKVQGTEGLAVAKMDGTQNIVSTLDFAWSSYPTILYFRAGETKPVEFTGNRTIDDLVAFANEHGSTGFHVGAPEGLVLLQKRASYRTAVDL